VTSSKPCARTRATTGMRITTLRACVRTSQMSSLSMCEGMDNSKLALRCQLRSREFLVKVAFFFCRCRATVTFACSVLICNCSRPHCVGWFCERSPRMPIGGKYKSPFFFRFCLLVLLSCTCNRDLMGFQTCVATELFVDISHCRSWGGVPEIFVSHPSNAPRGFPWSLWCQVTKSQHTRILPSIEQNW